MKLFDTVFVPLLYQAALLVRAWIEILAQRVSMIESYAALLVRAWIEISSTWSANALLACRSPRESVD